MQNLKKFPVTVIGLLFVLLVPNLYAEDISFEESRWKVLSYNKIKPNSVFFKDGMLKIDVSQSAGPIIYKLDKTKQVKGFVVKGQLKGAKNVEESEFDEDSILRVGLVAEGQNTMSGFKKLFAADWVKTLFELVPENSGLDKIYFYNVTNREKLLGKTRVHPNSEFILEKNAFYLKKEGVFQMKVTLVEPLRVAAIWLSVDGDDTRSSFQTVVHEIDLR